MKIINTNILTPVFQSVNKIILIVSSAGYIQKLSQNFKLRIHKMQHKHGALIQNAAIKIRTGRNLNNFIIFSLNCSCFRKVAQAFTNTFLEKNLINISYFIILISTDLKIFIQ